MLRLSLVTPGSLHGSIIQESIVMIFAYIGPETMMPIASGIAAVVGVFLMFGRSVMLVLRNIGRKVGLLSDRRDFARVRKTNLSAAAVAPGTAAEEKPAVGGES
jgi:hypothetical protein